MCAFQLSGAIRTLEKISVGRQKTKDWLKLLYLCLYMARLETLDVCSQIGNIMKVNLAQLIVVNPFQLESQVIMTDR